MESIYLKLNKNRKAKIVKKLNPFNSTLEVTKEQYKNIKTSDKRIIPSSDIDDILRQAKIWGYTQIKFTKQ